MGKRRVFKNKISNIRHYRIKRKQKHDRSASMTINTRRWNGGEGWGVGAVCPDRTAGGGKNPRQNTSTPNTTANHPNPNRIVKSIKHQPRKHTNPGNPLCPTSFPRDPFLSTMSSDAIDSLLEEPRVFVKDSIQLLQRCTKPDQKEYWQIARAVTMGFFVMGFIGFMVKLIHIPINNIIVGGA